MSAALNAKLKFNKLGHRTSPKANNNLGEYVKYNIFIKRVFAN